MVTRTSSFWIREREARMATRVRGACKRRPYPTPKERGAAPCWPSVVARPPVQSVQASTLATAFCGAPSPSTTSSPALAASPDSVFTSPASTYMASALPLGFPAAPPTESRLAPHP